MTTPEKHHQDRLGYSGHSGAFETCWGCGRDKAKCEKKRRFESWEAADYAVKDLNERENYAEPVVRYRCRWCNFWHLTHAQSPTNGRTSRIRVKRAERQRRKWVTAKELELRVARLVQP